MFEDTPFSLHKGSKTTNKTMPVQWRSQNTADARAQCGHITFASSALPGFSRLQYRCRRNWGGGGLGDAPPGNFGIFELHRSILRLL